MGVSAHVDYFRVRRLTAHSRLWPWWVEFSGFRLDFGESVREAIETVASGAVLEPPAEHFEDMLRDSGWSEKLTDTHIAAVELATLLLIVLATAVLARACGCNLDKIHYRVNHRCLNEESGSPISMCGKCFGFGHYSPRSAFTGSTMAARWAGSAAARRGYNAQNHRRSTQNEWIPGSGAEQFGLHKMACGEGRGNSNPAVRDRRTNHETLFLSPGRV